MKSSALALAVIVAWLDGCGSSAGGGVGGSASSSESGSSSSGFSSGTDSSSSGGASGSSADGGSGGVEASSGGGGVPMEACTNPTFTTSSETGGMTFGAYYVYNNMWNTSAKLGPQTLSACSYDSWYVVSSQTDQQGAVLTYPNVQENFSQTIASFNALTSTFAEASPHVGIYEDAYDIWFNGFGAGHTELMIWVDNEKQVPAGDKVATTTLDGRAYDVWKTSDSSYIAFVATATFTSGSIDLLQIFNYMVTEGWVASSAMLSQIDFGVEIVDTAGGNGIYQFMDFSITAK
jgi:hypothetical protein